MVGIQVVKVFSHAKDAALAVYVAGKSTFDGGILERGTENLAGGFAHAAEFGFASGRKVKHQGVQNARIGTEILPLPLAL
jgi:hypothetical protein